MCVWNGKTCLSEQSQDLTGSLVTEEDKVVFSMSLFFMSSFNSDISTCHLSSHHAGGPRCNFILTCLQCHMSLLIYHCCGRMIKCLQGASEERNAHGNHLSWWTTFRTFKKHHSDTILLRLLLQQCNLAKMLSKSTTTTKYCYYVLKGCVLCF